VVVGARLHAVAPAALVIDRSGFVDEMPVFDRNRVHQLTKTLERRYS